VFTSISNQEAASRTGLWPIKIPDGIADEKVLFLSDILPTGWQAVVNAEVAPGSTLAIFGAGPVGLMAAASAKLAGAERIWMIDHHDYRLEFARRTYGVETINFDRDDDPASILIDATQGRGVDAVGFEAKGSTTESVLAALKLEGGSSKALRKRIAA
jgi:threonine dehydrogenase-like Zn-dependent dehydrogenase